MQVDVRSQSLLAGHKGLVVGFAIEHSIAHGCTRMFRDCGADEVVQHYGVMGPVKAAVFVRVVRSATEVRPFRDHFEAPRVYLSTVLSQAELRCR